MSRKKIWKVNKKKFIEAFKDEYKPTSDGRFWCKYDGTEILEIINEIGFDYSLLIHTITKGKALNNSGYQMVATRIGTMGVHRLVADAWCVHPDGYDEVDHKDGDKTNNDYRNLQWVTRSQNMKRAWQNGLVSHPSFTFRYMKDSETLIYLKSKQRVHMAPDEYVAFRIQLGLPVKTWMLEYLEK